jgi:hypothetical protein
MAVPATSPLVASRRLTNNSTPPGGPQTAFAPPDTKLSPTDQDTSPAVPAEPPQANGSYRPGVKQTISMLLAEPLAKVKLCAPK